MWTKTALPIAPAESLGNLTQSKYNTVQDIVKSLAEELGLNLGKAGTHCWAVGGATGYTQRGVSSEVVMAKGRWRSEATRLRYSRVLLRTFWKLQIFLNSWFYV